MKEMVIVGRGGEGVVVASQILADALARAGSWVQSFPEFTAERRGAPISAYVRWDDAPIHRRYKVRDCDVLAVVSPSPPSPQAVSNVKPGGLIVLNRETRYPYNGPFDIARVPASAIAEREGILSSEGRPMGNMALLGACMHLLLPDGLPFLEQAIASRMGRVADANVRAAREGYAQCTTQHSLAGDAPLDAALVLRNAPKPARAAAPLFSGTTTDALRNQTGTWSLDRPVIGEACTACAVCALFCPEGAISRSDGTMVVDYLHCKGCGICEVVCPVRNAVAMEEVRA